MGIVSRVSGKFVFKQTPNKPAGVVAAHAGGTKAAATSTGTYENISISTVATTADSIIFGHPAIPGRVLNVVNNGAASAQVFGLGTDTINGVATGTGVAQAAGLSAVYFCVVAGNWARVLSA
jgi:hypothetical protein